MSRSSASASIALRARSALVVGGDQHDRQERRLRLRLHAPADLVARDLRHAHVEDHQVGLLAAPRGERLLAVGDRDHPAAGVLEQLTVEHPVGRAVVGDQDRSARLGDRHRQDVVERRLRGDLVRRLEHRLDVVGTEGAGARRGAQLARPLLRLVGQGEPEMVEPVRGGDDLGAQRQLGAGQPARVAGAVAALVVRGDDLDGATQRGDRPQDPASELGMTLVDGPLLLVAPDSERRSTASGTPSLPRSCRRAPQTRSWRRRGSSSSRRAVAAASAATRSEWWRVRVSLPSSSSIMLKMYRFGRIELVAEGADPEQRAQPRDQLAPVERLVEEVVGARLEAAHLALGVGQRGEQNDGHEQVGRRPFRRRRLRNRRGAAS